MKVTVTAKNRGAGHAFPTGVTDIREPWLELQAVDANKTVIARYGGPAADGTIPLTAARFGMDIAKPDGTLLFLHELSESTRIPFMRFVPPLGTVDVVYVEAPSALPVGARPSSTRCSSTGTCAPRISAPRPETRPRRRPRSRSRGAPCA